MKFYEDDGYLLRRHDNHVTEKFLVASKSWERTTAFNLMTDATPLPREYAVKMLPEGCDPAVLDAPLVLAAK